MARPAQSQEDLRAWIADEARRAGFDVAGIADARGKRDNACHLSRFLARGYHGTMDWLQTTAERRTSPRALWPQAKSVIMLGLNYGPQRNPMEMLEHRDIGVISVYARNRDYHDLIKGRLKGIAGRLAARSGADVKVFVDTAPVMEKPLAEASGIGWQGKHTNLVSRDFGSWLFLGSIFTTLEIDPDEPETDHCGSCRACLDVCPTDAFPAPYQLDARRCISYLTIEHKGPIPHEFRRAIGNRIFGCDDCLAVCPWNKFAVSAREARLRARSDLERPDIATLVELDDTAFRKKFSGSPVKRIGRDRFLRNVLIAAGNSGEKRFVPACRNHLRDASPVVRGAAVWALGQLLDIEAFNDLRHAFAADERDEEVAVEWRKAAAGLRQEA